MPANLTIAGSTLALTAVLNGGTSRWVGLGTGQSPTGLVGEASGGGYARVPTGTLTVSGASGTSSAAITFTGFTVTLGSFTHLGVFDAASGGNCLAVGSLTAAVNITAGGSITIQAGDLDLNSVTAT